MAMRFDMTPSEIARHDAELITNPEAVLLEVTQRAMQFTEFLRVSASRNADLGALNGLAHMVTNGTHTVVDLLRYRIETGRMNGGDNA